MLKTSLSEMFNLELPIIMAPMFLVSNIDMVVAAGKAGISGSIPAHNFRSIPELEKALREMKEKSPRPFGINLIVNKSNPDYSKQLKACLEYQVDYFITSLGSPEEVIKAAHQKGIKVFCDVVDLDYAQKVVKLGADGLIAVNSGAGGHAGDIPASVLVPLLKKHFSIPIISAGGVGTGAGLLSMIALGADGISMGSPFISTKESPVSKEYKQAILSYGAKDIVRTTKLSGTPCTVIKTPYVKKIGTEQNLLETWLNKNKQIKKYAKMLSFYRGMKLMEKAAFSATYKTVWCAGSSIEFVDKEETIQDVVQRMKVEYNQALKQLTQIGQA